MSKRSVAKNKIQLVVCVCLLTVRPLALYEKVFMSGVELAAHLLFEKRLMP
jgi:hypothetical protein